jgi:hypothetical protein
MRFGLFRMVLASALLVTLSQVPGNPTHSTAYADQNEFCVGFSEGYQSIAGSMVIVPICPIAPITPIGSTSFREGIKAGIRSACRQYPDKC